MSTGATIVWLRMDLRLADQPALVSACERGGPVVPVFIWSPEEEAPWEPGAARRWWLHESLCALDASLRAVGSRLVLRAGPTLETLRELVEQTGAERVVWSRRYEPAVIARDKAVKAALLADGIEAESFNSHLLFEPWQVRTKTGGPYRVFTPFWKTCSAMPEPEAPLDAPRAVPGPKRWPKGLKVDALGLLPRIKWHEDMAAHWSPGEVGAGNRLQAFLDEAVTGYKDQRDTPSVDGTSRISPHLCHGEVGPRQIWHAVRRRMRDDGVKDGSDAGKQCWSYLREIGWREFGYHVLYHYPHTPQQPLQERYRAFPWLEDEQQLRAWQRGRTGYPLIDAGMRQLWKHGWMHNRVRMVVASFLVKDLLLSWEHGARWFWDTLVDADLANNTLGWQWAGGCGADAAPYFRVFNPVTQSEKHDPDGAYIRAFVEELSVCDAKMIHAPWDAKPTLQQGETITAYPAPVVNHSEARDRALAALDRLKQDAPMLSK